MEDLYTYLVVFEAIVSSTLIREVLGARLPAFYSLKALLNAKNRFPKFKKLILALIVATPEAQVVLSWAHSHWHDTVFLIIQTHER